MTISEHTRTQLGSVSTATLQAQLFRRGLRNTFLFGLKPLNPQAYSFVGQAFTLRFIPAREDLETTDSFANPSNAQRVAIESCELGDVLVIDCRGILDAGSAGHILVTRLMKRGVAALVTDGALRDSPRIGAEPFPAFSAAVSANLSLCRHHPADVQQPIACAGVAVFPGDVVVGDAEGVIVIPASMADEVAEEAAEQERLEEFILQRVVDGAPLDGTYPPDEKTLAEYRAGQEQER